MCACASSPQGCVGGERLSSSRKKRSRKRKRDGLRRVSSRISKGSLYKKLITSSVPNCSSFANPAFHGRYERICGNASGVSGRRETELLQEEAKSQKEKRCSRKKSIFSDI
ncbi:hypothetical protein G2W53_040140 [Senna tora]|uniref:Uncharacterized protein n=1 Tax=Senna tora TaxID=362788 RepID=A0A834W8L4_9FABA|nr:hypothetical protein G2W53_040140 [Senna tora]